ncbi:MAG TPA: hypothetical protein VGE41_09880 [Verrucomicrobiae bacterium]
MSESFRVRLLLDGHGAFPDFFSQAVQPDFAPPPQDHAGQKCRYTRAPKDFGQSTALGCSKADANQEADQAAQNHQNTHKFF